MDKHPELFWNWFVANSERLTMLNDLDEAVRQQLLDEMQHQLDAYCEGLTFEIGEQTAQGRTLTISADGDFDREQFASAMCVSSSTLYNKLRALTGQSVTGFINSIRLKEACRIMRQQPGIKMTELSMEVGFNTPKYFTKLFKKEFGMLPSEYISESKG